MSVMATSLLMMRIKRQTEKNRMRDRKTRKQCHQGVELDDGAELYNSEGHYGNEERACNMKMKECNKQE